jgi:hypothetical protein
MLEGKVETESVVHILVGSGQVRQLRPVKLYILAAPAPPISR